MPRLTLSVGIAAAVVVGGFMPSRGAASSSTPRQSVLFNTKASSTQTFQMYAAIPQPDLWRDAEVVLNSNSPSTRTVIPTFYVHGGRKVGRALSIASLQVRWVSLGPLLQEMRLQLNELEALQLEYEGHLLEVGAQVTLFGPPGAGSVDVAFSMAGDFRSKVRESVWWLPPQGRAVTTIGNASSEPIVVQIHDGAGFEGRLVLPPFGTHTLERFARSGDRRQHESNESDEREHEASVGWMRLTVESGPIQNLRASGFAETADRRLASVLRFVDPGSAKQANLFASAVGLQGTELHLVLRNTSDLPLTATPRFLPASGDINEGVTLAPVALSAGATREVNLQPLTALASARIDLAEVSAQIVSDGAPGALVGAFAVLDYRTLVAYDVPLRDSGPLRQSTGSYPWRLDDDYASRVSITNVGLVSAEFAAHIFYPGGEYHFTRRTLAPGQTADFDLRQFRDEQVPDALGHTLPVQLQQGQFRWSVWGRTPDARLNGRTEIVSQSRGVGSSYSCLTCCPDSLKRGSMSPSNPQVVVNQTIQASVVSVQTDCYGNVTATYPMPLNNTTIYNPGQQYLSVYMTGDGAVSLLGVSAGSVTIDIYTPGWDYEPNPEGTDCTSSPVTADAIGAVTIQAQVPTYFAIIGTPQYTQGPPAPYVYNVNRQILDQVHNPINGVRFVHEFFVPDPPSGNCTSLPVTTNDANSDQYGIFGPDLYSLPGNAPNPCSSSSVQHFQVDGRDIVTTYSVNWQYSGVTVTQQ